MQSKLLFPILAALIGLTKVSAQQCFEFAMRDMGPEEHFFAQTTDAKTAGYARVYLALPIAQRPMIIGKIARGKEINLPWSWHFVDGWSFAEVATEVCDGRPSYVEAHLDEWLKAPVYYCPWPSYVISECIKLPSGVIEGAPSIQARAGSQALTYRLTRASEVSLELRRLDGSLAANLPQARQTAGEHTLEINTRDLARGVYRLILKADGRALTGTAVVVQ